MATIYPINCNPAGGNQVTDDYNKNGTENSRERSDCKGRACVQPGDHLFWFNRPRLILFLINVVLFQNAFQLAFLAWSWISSNFFLLFISQYDSP
ncbi:hypothetical protein ACOSQ3_009284 [Xanthoceras sorbifolium]